MRKNHGSNTTDSNGSDRPQSIGSLVVSIVVPAKRGDREPPAAIRNRTIRPVESSKVAQNEPLPNTDPSIASGWAVWRPGG